MRELLEQASRYTQVPEASWGAPSQVSIDEMEAAHLRALGYVIDPLEVPEKRHAER